MTLSARELEAARSLLFVPALERRFVQKAHARGAGAIILDLEDSIAPAQKSAARAALGAAAGTLRATGVRHVVVRVNAGVQEDLRAAVEAGADAVLLPKVESVADVQAAGHALHDAEAAVGRPATSMILLVETPRAVIDVQALAVQKRVTGLVLGSEDLALALGVEPSAQALLHSAQQVVLAARAAAKVPLGVPGSLASLAADGGFGDSAALARRIGMAGAVCIHPNQVALINAAFAPSESDLAHARRILQAFAEASAAGKGAVALDGKMLDLPIVERARLLVEGA